MLSETEMEHLVAEYTVKEMDLPCFSNSLFLHKTAADMPVLPCVLYPIMIYIYIPLTSWKCTSEARASHLLTPSYPVPLLPQ